jgi:hypothetical protein
MRRFWTAVMVLGVVAVVVMFFMAGESASSAGARFMSALKAGDAKTLADMSLVEGMSRDQIEGEWKKCMENTKYYQFAYTVKGADTPKEGEALIRLEVVRNVSTTSYGENFQFKMVRKPDGWKVDVATINRDFYPFMPRWTMRVASAG